MIKTETLNKLKTIQELKFLMYLSEVEEWKHNKDNRDYLSKMLYIAGITLKCMLKSLKDRGLIYKTSKGIYKISKDIIQ